MPISHNNHSLGYRLGSQERHVSTETKHVSSQQSGARASVHQLPCPRVTCDVTSGMWAEPGPQCVIITVREVKQHSLVTNNTNDSDCKKARPGPLEVKYISQTINCQAGDNT